MTKPKIKTEIRTYPSFFKEKVIKKAINKIKNLNKVETHSEKIRSIKFKNGIERSYTDQEYFFEDYPKCSSCCFSKLFSKRKQINPTYELAFIYTGKETSILLSSPEEKTIKEVFTIFEKNKDKDKIKPIIFISHGGENKEWEEVKKCLIKIFGKRQIKYYEKEPRISRNVTDKIIKIINQCNFAVVIMTGEDKIIEKGGEEEKINFCPRGNVIHELGLCQSRIGLEYTIMLADDKVKLPTNIDRIDHIKFKKNKISKSLKDLIKTIKNSKVKSV